MTLKIISNRPSRRCMESRCTRVDYAGQGITVTGVRCMSEKRYPDLEQPLHFLNAALVREKQNDMVIGLDH